MTGPVRVLVAKVGLDGHDRGARIITAAFREAGFEVLYTGLHQTPETVVRTALEKDVDVVALSVLSGAHMTLIPRVRELLVEAGAGDKLVTGGGVIPEEDAGRLRAIGVGRLFGPGTPTSEPIDYIRSWYEKKLVEGGRSEACGHDRAESGERHASQPRDRIPECHPNPSDGAGDPGRDRRTREGRGPDRGLPRDGRAGPPAPLRQHLPGSGRRNDPRY